MSRRKEERDVDGYSQQEENANGCCCEGSERKTVRTEEEKKDLNSRLNRVIGQMNGVKRMLEEDRYCEDVLVQLAAIDRGIRSLTAHILAKHMHSCIVHDVQNGDTGALDGIVELFKRFV